MQNRFSHICLGIILGVSGTTGLFYKSLDKQAEVFVGKRKTYETEAVQTFVEAGHWKVLALRDQDYTRGLCTAWWFDLSGKERKLKKDLK